MTSALMTRRPVWPRLLGAVSALWVVLAGAVGWVVLNSRFCVSSDRPWPPSRGTELLCTRGDIPYEPIFLTFVLAAFVGLAVVVRTWGDPSRTRWLLLAAAAPVVAYGVLRLVVLV